MKKFYVFWILICLSFNLIAQETSLTHTGTLFDSFENPVQTAFTKNKSKRYAINLLLPSISTNIKFEGGAENQIKNFLFGNKIISDSIRNSNSPNDIRASLNLYLLMLKIHLSDEYNQEIGFSLQLRNDGDFLITNQTLLIPKNFTSLEEGNYPNFYNNKINNQTYYQLGFSYRENYSESLAFGAKLSLLSGVIYNKTDITASNLEITQNEYFAKLQGQQISSYGVNKIDANTFKPNLKNLGVALSLGTSYKTKKGYYLTAHLKDLGFIRWSKNTSIYNFNDSTTGYRVNETIQEGRFKSDLDSLLIRNGSTSRFLTSLNTKLELAASKNFGNYKPVVVANYSTLTNNTNISLLNNYQYKIFNFGLNAFYDTNFGFNLGTLFLIKSPNTEFYFGTERLLPTYYLTKGYISKDNTISKSPSYVNMFMGITLKFGKKIQSPGQADWVDGLNDQETGFVYRLSNKERRSLFKRKNKSKKN